MFKIICCTFFLWIATVVFLPPVALGEMTFRPATLIAQAPNDNSPADASDAANAPNIPPPLGADKEGDSFAPGVRPNSPQPTPSVKPDPAQNRANVSRNPYDLEALKAFDAGSHRTE
ncbi:MAG: hypothetical protein WCD18_11860 [Thermosynechococcaceae cyanobacterium]